MGEAKRRQKIEFSKRLVAAWEADQCINFAIALARITGWLLHIDWWVPTTDPDEDIPVQRFKPLRVYVADNAENVFDARGIRDVFSFSQKTTIRIARQFGTGMVRTRFYPESGLATLPLFAMPDESKIASAAAAIQANAGFLGQIPLRSPTSIPAYRAAHFTFGSCAAYAEALHAAIGLEPIALIANRYRPGYESARTGVDGYFHSAVRHSKELAEDVWGIEPIKKMADRFGVLDYEISSTEHAKVVANLRRNTPALFEKAYSEAVELIAAHRNPK